MQGDSLQLPCLGSSVLQMDDVPQWLEQSPLQTPPFYLLPPPLPCLQCSLGSLFPIPCDDFREQELPPCLGDAGEAGGESRHCPGHAGLLLQIHSGVSGAHCWVSSMLGSVSELGVCITEFFHLFFLFTQASLSVSPARCSPEAMRH